MVLYHHIAPLSPPLPLPIGNTVRGQRIYGSHSLSELVVVSSSAPTVILDKRRWVEGEASRQTSWGYVTKTAASFADPAAPLVLTQLLTG